MSLSQAFANSYHQQPENDAFCFEKTAPAGHQIFEVTPTSWRASDDTRIIRTSPHTEDNAFENAHDYASATAALYNKDGRMMRTIVVMHDADQTVQMSDAAIMQCVDDCRRAASWNFNKTA